MLKMRSLTLLLAATTSLSAAPLLVNVEQGESFILEIAPTDSFDTIIGTISDYMTATQPEDSEETMSIALNLTIQNAVAVAADIKAPSQAKYSVQPPRNYNIPLTAEDKKNITYITRTLANDNLISIGLSRNALRQAGDRLEHLHPFKFVEALCEDEETKVCVKNIQKRGWVWKEFLGGITGSLTNEQAVGNVLPYVDAFGAQIKVAPALLQPSIQGQRWEELVNIIIANTPRKGNDRYNY